MLEDCLAKREKSIESDDDASAIAVHRSARLFATLLSYEGGTFRSGVISKEYSDSEGPREIEDDVTTRRREVESLPTARAGGEEEQGKSAAAVLSNGSTSAMTAKE